MENLERKPNRQENIKVKNSKGQNLDAVVHRPQKETGTLAILCPGYLDSKDYNGLIGLAKTLADNGYTAVRFDPTGVWASEGEISEYSVTQYLRDIQSIKEHMRSRNKYNKILIAGHSMGGRMALLTAELDEEISAVINVMGNPKISGTSKWDPETGIRKNKRDLPGNPEQSKEMLLPRSFLDDALKYDVLDKIDRIKVPVLFIGGEEDTVCPVEVMRSMYNAAKCPKEFIVIPGIGHDYRHSETEVEEVDKIIDREIKRLILWNEKTV